MSLSAFKPPQPNVLFSASVLLRRRSRIDAAGSDFVQERLRVAIDNDSRASDSEASDTEWHSTVVSLSQLAYPAEDVADSTSETAAKTMLPLRRPASE